MKKLLPFLFVFLGIFAIQASENNDAVELKKKLLKVNKFWQGKTLNPSDIQALKSPKSETEKIQFHLRLVHQKLSEKNVDCLNLDQKQKRTQALEILKTYYQAGRFPINLHHSYRIPYFIDDHGTACAVGQLIIETGHPEISRLIAKESNYAYIEEMNYPQVEAWAKNYGFTLDELKWIQPAYSPYCQPGTHRDPDCHDGNGCINPDFAADGLIPPFDLLIEYNDGSGWLVDSSQMLFLYGARIGQHRITVTDSLDTSRVYNYTINNAPEINILANITHQTDSNNCNAGLSVQISNGNPPYRIELIRQNPNGWWLDSSGQFSNLCAGNYNIIVYDSTLCQKQKSIQINNLATSIADKILASINLSPNPFKNSFKVSFDSPISFQYRIFNLNGQLVQAGNSISNELIDFEAENKGIYFLEVRRDNQVYTEKIIKTK